MERQLVADIAKSDDGQRVCLAVSQLVADELKTHYGQRRNIRVVYNAVDVAEPDLATMAKQRNQLREKLQLKPRDLLFVTIAMNFELKGVAETMRAFARWREQNPSAPNARLAIVGRQRPSAYRRLARKLGVKHAVIFVPPTEDVRCWYAASDACLLLSWYDPCSRVILEAARYWVPTITTAYNGASEILRDGAGVVVDSPDNLEAVVSAMDQVADQSRRRAFREACLRVDGQLSTEQHVDRLLDIYVELLGSRVARPTVPLRVLRLEGTRVPVGSKPAGDRVVPAHEAEQSVKKAA